MKGDVYGLDPLPLLSFHSVTILEKMRKGKYVNSKI
jgi:hypothetical protein